ncbi:MAG: type II toxin-antitoxin system VapC family toxin [Acidobacteriaceae bacterium]
MILPDTSIWIDHLRQADRQLAEILFSKNALGHPFVIGEIALGSIPKRGLVLAQMHALRQPRIAMHHEVLAMIHGHALYRHGLGYIDVHLLASALLTPGTQLWTRDKRLRAAAKQLGLDAGLA